MSYKVKVCSLGRRVVSDLGFRLGFKVRFYRHIKGDPFHRHCVAQSRKIWMPVLAPRHPRTKWSSKDDPPKINVTAWGTGRVRNNRHSRRVIHKL